MSTEEPVKQFNLKVAELLKESSAEDISEILKAEESVISVMHNNNHQNGSQAE